jgi:hypothetical protein
MVQELARLRYSTGEYEGVHRDSRRDNRDNGGDIRWDKGEDNITRSPQVCKLKRSY